MVREIFEQHSLLTTFLSSRVRILGMESVLKHPWYRLHWFTWVVILIAGLSLIPSELQPRLLSSGTYVFGSIRTYSTELRYGWPLVHLDTVEIGPGFPAPFPSPSFTYKWNYSLLFPNLAFCSFLISSTGFVAEKWLRKPHPTQFSIRSFLAITGVVGILISLVANEQPIYQILGKSLSSPLN